VFQSAFWTWKVLRLRPTPVILRCLFRAHPHRLVERFPCSRGAFTFARGIDALASLACHVFGCLRRRASSHSQAFGHRALVNTTSRACSVRSGDPVLERYRSTLAVTRLSDYGSMVRAQRTPSMPGEPTASCQLELHRLQGPRSWDWCRTSLHRRPSPALLVRPLWDAASVTEVPRIADRSCLPARPKSTSKTHSGSDFDISLGVRFLTAKLAQAIVAVRFTSPHPSALRVSHPFNGLIPPEPRGFVSLHIRP
jgi:hypothetical protein